MTKRFFRRRKSDFSEDLLTWLKKQRQPVPLLSATLEYEDVTLARQWLSQAKAAQGLDHTEALEQQFANWLGGGEIRAFMGGRAALYALNRALGLGPGDGVIVPAFSCQCVANAFRYVGVQIQYADIELEGFGLDLESVKQNLRPNTRAIMIQHTFGLVGRDFEALLAWAKEKDLLIIEDCAHALGARFKGQLLGTFGDGAVFSSERSKVISTIHGGLAVAHQTEAKKRLVWIAQDSPTPEWDSIEKQLKSVVHDYYVHCHPYRQWTKIWAKRHFEGEVLPQMWEIELNGKEVFKRYEERMPSAIAALLQLQLGKLERVLQKRHQAVQAWQTICQQNHWQTPTPIEFSEPSWVRLPIWIKDRDQRVAIAKDLNVEVGVWFGSARHPLPFDYSDFPKAKQAASHILNLPSYLI